MIALLDTSEDLDVCAAELGVPVEQLFSPLTRFRDRHPDRKKAADNGGFKGVDIPALLALLERENASARRTLELFEFWKRRICRYRGTRSRRSLSADRRNGR